MNNKAQTCLTRLIKQKFNHKINKYEYFNSALTHKSTSNNNYERLELLGDSVIQLTITELLFSKYPEYTEGQMTVVRQKLVNSKNLKEMFLRLNLESLFKIFNPKLSDGNLYSDVFESLIGAFYLDSDYITVRDLLNTLFIPLISKQLLEKDSKTLLQEYMHARKLKLPKYKTYSSKDQKYKYLVTCEILDLKLKESLLSNKVKPAEQKLAHIILKTLNEKN